MENLFYTFLTIIGIFIIILFAILLSLNIINDIIYEFNKLKNRKEK